MMFKVLLLVVLVVVIVQAEYDVKDVKAYAKLCMQCCKDKPKPLQVFTICRKSDF